MRIVNVAILGGGTGSSMVLEALRDIHDISLTAIVAMSDSGGSTRDWRQWYGVRPPGDLRNNMAPLIPDPIIEELFQFRFSPENHTDEVPGVAGHPVGNVLLGALQIIHKNRLIPALEKLHRLLGIRENHRVFPVTTESVDLIATYNDGRTIEGEADIDMPKEPVALPICELCISPEHAHICDQSACAIEKADLLVFAPGSLFTSSVAAILPKGVKECIHDCKGKVLYLCNIMTQPGQTGPSKHGHPSSHMMARYHVETLEKYSERPFDHVIYNNRKPKEEILQRYEGVGCRFVEWDIDTRAFGTSRFIPTDLLHDRAEKAQLVRHSPKKLGTTLMKLVT